jgi:hypothetical protein
LHGQEPPVSGIRLHPFRPGSQVPLHSSYLRSLGELTLCASGEGAAVSRRVSRRKGQLRSSDQSGSSLGKIAAKIRDSADREARLPRWLSSHFSLPHHRPSAGVRISDRRAVALD